MPYKDPNKSAESKRKSYEKYKEKWPERQKILRDRVKRYVFQLKKDSGGCKRCGEKHPAALDFHHLDPLIKDKSSSDMINDKWSIERITKELENCEIVCANCHRKIHWVIQHPDDIDGYARLDN